jgi:hypothetical protein
MPRYKVWNPDDEGEDDALVVTDHSPSAAAINYASGVFHPGFLDSFELNVTDEDDNLYEVTVDVDYEPTFSAFAQKVKK